MSEKKRHIYKLNNGIEKEEQELIYFHYFENRSETDLAKAYGISQQAISKKIRKIREKIKNLLKI